MSRGSEKITSHIYYGTIDPTAVDKIEHSKNSNAVLSQVSLLDSQSTTLKQQQFNIANYELQKSARFVPAPTLDSEIKARLKELGQPICLFGEGPYERRERLRFLLAQQPIKSQETQLYADTGKFEQQQRLFFSRGGPKLEKVRKEIAKYSLHRAIKRLKSDKLEYSKTDPLDIESSVLAYNRSVAAKIEGYISQVGSERPMCCAKFSPQGDAFLATSSWSPSIKLWLLTDCNEYSISLESHTERVNSLYWNPYFESTARQVPPKNKKEVLMKLEPSNSNVDTDPIVFSEGWHLLSGSFDSTIQIWNLSKNKPITVLKGHEDRVNRVECHPSARYLASTSHDETWRFWDIERGEELLIQEGHASAVYGLKFHPDGSLVFTGDTGGIIRAWDLRTGRTVLTLLGHVKQVLGITNNPWRTNQLATCSDDNTVRVWDIRKQRCIDVILAHNKLVSDVLYEPVHGRYIMSSSFDSTLKIWSSTDFSCSKILVGHESRIMGIDISHAGDCFVSTSFDRTFKIWTQTKELDGIIIN